MAKGWSNPKLRWSLVAALALIVLLAGVWFFWLRPRGWQPTTASANPSAASFAYSIFGVDQPIGVALSPDGTRLYVSERGGDRNVRVFDLKTRKQVQTLAPPDTEGGVNRRPTYVAVNQLGYVFVNDLNQKGISVYSPTGKFQGWLNPLGTNVPWNPLAVAFDKQGNMYVTDITEGKHRVLVFDNQNKLKLEFGIQGTGPGEFSFPNGVAVDQLGNIWVADSNNARIQVFDASGKLLSTLKDAAGRGMSLPRGIAFLRSGEAVIVDTMDSSVLVFNPRDAAKSYRVGEFGTENGQFRFPQGLAIDAGGRIYVADRDNNRVEVFK